MEREMYDALMARLDRLEELIGRAESPLMDAKECASYVGVTLQNLYKMTSKREIPHYKRGESRLVFDREEVTRWMLRSRVATDEELRSRAAARCAIRPLAEVARGRGRGKRNAATQTTNRHLDGI